MIVGMTTIEDSILHFAYLEGGKVSVTAGNAHSGEQGSFVLDADGFAASLGCALSMDGESGGNYEKADAALRAAGVPDTLRWIP